MIRFFLRILPGALILTVVVAATARADDFEIAVSLKVGEKKVESKDTQTVALSGRMPKRPVLRAAAGDRLQVKWRATNTHSSAALTDVLVHFFVVEEEKPGQEKVPPLDADANVRHEGVLSTDFKPGDKASGAFTLKIDKPGAYLVRVETIGTAAVHGHEHYTAIDIVVE